MTDGGRTVSWRYLLVLTVCYALSACLYYWIFFVAFGRVPVGITLILLAFSWACSVIFSVRYTEIIARPILDHKLYRWLLSVFIGVSYLFLPDLTHVFLKFAPFSLIFPLVISALLGKSLHNTRVGSKLAAPASAVILVSIEFAVFASPRWREKPIWEHSATSFRTTDSTSCWAGEQQFLKIPKTFVSDIYPMNPSSRYLTEYNRVTIAVSYPDIMPWNLASASADRTDRVEIHLWKNQCRDSLCGAYLSNYTKVPEYSTSQFDVYCKNEQCAAIKWHSGVGCQNILFARKHLTEFPTMAAKVNSLIESWHDN